MEKRLEIELLRIVSAFGIVWFHISITGKDIAYSGLISFLVISMYFSVKTNLDFNQVLLKRAKRILIPWVVWLLFYGAINVFFRSEPFIKTDNGLISGLLAGTSIHLWYMPFIFVVAIPFDILKRHINGSMLTYISGFLIILIFVMTEYWRPWSLSLGYPWAQYAHALNGVLLGVFFANCDTIPKSFCICFIMLFLLVVALFALSVAGVGYPYLLGIIATAVTLLPQWNWHANLKLNELSECTLGIYLSHIFWLMFFRKIGFLSGWWLPFVVFGVSAIVVWCLKKIVPRMSTYVV